MKNFKDGSGVVFDLRAENFDAFMDNYERLRETSDKVDFDVAKCIELPDLEEEGYGGNTNWRDTGASGRGGYQGGSGGYQSRGGGTGYQSRGGYNSSYNDRDNAGGSTWGNKTRGGYDNSSRDGGSSYVNKREEFGNRDYSSRDNDSSAKSWGRGTDSRGGRGGMQNSYGGQSDFRPRTTGPPRGDAPIIGGARGAKVGGNSTAGCVLYVSNLRYQVNE